MEREKAEAISTKLQTYMALETARIASDTKKLMEEFMRYALSGDEDGLRTATYKLDVVKARAEVLHNIVTILSGE